LVSSLIGLSHQLLAGFYTDSTGLNHDFVRAPDGVITTLYVPGAGKGSGQGTIPTYDDKPRGSQELNRIALEIARQPSLYVPLPQGMAPVPRTPGASGLRIPQVFRNRYGNQLAVPARASMWLW